MPHITQPTTRPSSVALEPAIVEPRKAYSGRARVLVRWAKPSKRGSVGRGRGRGCGDGQGCGSTAVEWWWCRKDRRSTKYLTLSSAVPDQRTERPPPSIAVGALVHRSVVLSKQLIYNYSAPAHLLRCGRSALLTCEKSEICCPLQPRREQFQRMVKAGRCG